MGVPTQLPAPASPAVQPWQELHPYRLPQVEHVLPEGVPVHVPGEVQPAQPEQPALVPQDAQVAKVGVPVHVGPVLKTCGGLAGVAAAVMQQMRVCPEQSSSVWHVLGQEL